MKQGINGCDPDSSSSRKCHFHPIFKKQIGLKSEYIWSLERTPQYIQKVFSIVAALPSTKASPLKSDLEVVGVKGQCILIHI